MPGTWLRKRSARVGQRVESASHYIETNAAPLSSVGFSVFYKRAAPVLGRTLVAELGLVLTYIFGHHHGISSLLWKSIMRK